MNKNARLCRFALQRTIMTALFALVTMMGHAQVKCHIEGKIMTDRYGDDVVVCKQGTDLRVNDDPSLHYKAVNGRFECDIEASHIDMYEVKLPRQMDEGSWFTAKFLVENGTVQIEMYEDKAPKVQSTGKEGRLHQELDSLEDVRFWNVVDEIDRELEEHKEKYFQPDLISAYNTLKRSDADILPQEYIDSVRNVLNAFLDDEHQGYNDDGWMLWQRRESIAKGVRPFRVEYYSEHPMLWAYYDVLPSIQALTDADKFTNFNPEPHEQMVALYETKLCNFYKGHPVHEQITTALTALRLQPGKSYIDYNVRNIDGQLVPISSLISGKVALIDLWASWCGPCRKHSKDMIPVYEKYKDNGFTVVAIARESKREDMENAALKDGYPWTSLLELNDENQVWHKNGAGNAGGAMFLIDRDGTILSTSTDAEELEPLIKKALNIE